MLEAGVGTGKNAAYYPQILFALLHQAEPTTTSAAVGAAPRRAAGSVAFRGGLRAPSVQRGIDRNSPAATIGTKSIDFMA